MNTTANKERPAVRDLAGSYVAGDLDPAEDTAFRQALAEDPGLQTEVAFWKGLSGKWDDGVGETTLGRGFADAILARSQREQNGARIIRLPLWAVALGSAAAAALVVALVLPRGGQPGEMYGEDGFAVAVTATTGSWDAVLPRALVTHVVSGSDGLTNLPQHVRPYAGIWTRPVDITVGARAGGGHLILRVAGGSPADRAGLRPGDIIRSIDQCPVFTPACIAHQLETRQPGDTLHLDIWRPRTGEERVAELTLETLYE